MAIIKNIQTLGKVLIILCDTDPSLGLGTDAPIGSIATCEDGSGLFYKKGLLDTDWI